MSVLLFFWGAFILFTTWAIWDTARTKRKEREETERRAAAARAKAEAAARAKAEKARCKAERQAKEAAKPKGKRGRPRKTPVEPVALPAPDPEHAPEPVQPEPPADDPAPVAPAPVQNAPLPFKGNNVFAGEVVAFTGTIRGMTRAEAIKAVEANGGRAFDSMPASTTILVVGDDPGLNKLDKADQWIGQVRKITQDQFKAKLAAPLTLTPDEFIAAFVS